jgi:hypothetical protein
LTKYKLHYYLPLELSTEGYSFLLLRHLLGDVWLMLVIINFTQGPGVLLRARTNGGKRTDLTFYPTSVNIWTHFSITVFIMTGIRLMLGNMVALLVEVEGFLIAQILFNNLMKNFWVAEGLHTSVSGSRDMSVPFDIIPTQLLTYAKITTWTAMVLGYMEGTTILPVVVGLAMMMYFRNEERVQIFLAGIFTANSALLLLGISCKDPLLKDCRSGKSHAEPPARQHNSSIEDNSQDKIFSLLEFLQLTDQQATRIRRVTGYQGKPGLIES